MCCKKLLRYPAQVPLFECAEFTGMSGMNQAVPNLGGTLSDIGVCHIWEEGTLRTLSRETSHSVPRCISRKWHMKPMAA